MAFFVHTEIFWTSSSLGTRTVVSMTFT